MAFGDFATLLSSFSGPDESPLSEGGHWLRDNASAPGQVLQIVSHQVTRNVGSTTESDYFWTPVFFGPDAESYMTCVSTTGPDGAGANQMDLWLRFAGFDPNFPGSDPNTQGYALIYNGVGRPGDWSIITVVNGVATRLAAATQTVNNGDKIGFRVQGNSMDAWLNTGAGWNQIVATTDPISRYLNVGYMAFGCATPSIVLDNVFAGTIPGSIVPRVYRRLPGLRI